MEIKTVKDLRELLGHLPGDAILNFSLGCNNDKDTTSDGFMVSFVYQIIALIYSGRRSLHLIDAELRLPCDDDKDNGFVNFEFLASYREDCETMDSIVEDFYRKHGYIFK